MSTSKKGKFSIADATSKMTDTDKTAARKRLDDIERELKTFGDYELRDDSQLAFQFAARVGDGANMTLADVAADIVIAQDLYNHTCYRELWSNDMKAVATWLKTTYPNLSWAKTWGLIRANLDPCCKLEATLRAAGQVNIG